MSAYMVDKVHIDVLIAAGLKGPSGQAVSPDNAWHGITWCQRDPETTDDFRTSQLDYTTADVVGSMLIGENLNSIHARYPDTIENPDATPGPIERYWDDLYTWTDPRIRLSAVEILKAIRGYEYQSCEHAGWRSSEARRFCDTLRDATINHLEGMNEAPWTWEAEDVATRRLSVVR